MYFRGNPENMGVTEAETPVTPETARLKWSQKLGSGWTSSPTPPLIVNGDLYTAWGTTVYRLDRETGAVLTQGSLAGEAGFALNPVTYGEGMLFVPISGGRIQALRADTLESLWISEAFEGGTQSLTVAACRNGYVYTGVWNSETETGSYFCLSVTDEDPQKPDETKLHTWRLDHPGGFYWAGAYVSDRYMLFGSDDGAPEGQNGTSVLYSVSPVTGEILDTIEDIPGDIRSTVSFDKVTGTAFCSTKGGLFIRVKVKDNGTFDHSSFKTLDLQGMATGTPLVYQGTAFIGAAGESQFSAEGHRYYVIDTATMEVKTVVEDIPGYVQTSALLSSAKAEETGKVHVYLTYNSKPGGIYCLEYDLKTGACRGYDLFLPAGDLAEYCICSLVCDSEGTLYYRNDSGCMMAVERNEAYLSGLTADTGRWLQEFSPAQESLELAVPPGTQQVTFVPEVPEGASVTMNGGTDMTLALKDGAGEAVFAVTAGGDARTYSVGVREASQDASLQELKVTDSNAYAADGKTLAPAFDPDTLEYVCLGAGGRNFLNLWPAPSDPGAEVKVLAVSGVTRNVNSDGSIDVTSTSSDGHSRYAIYFEGSASVKVRVTAEDGVTVREYVLRFTDADTCLILDRTELALKTGETAKLTASIASLKEGSGTEKPAVTWSSSAPAAVSVDGEGNVKAVKEGEAVITAAAGTLTASCTVRVTEEEPPDSPPPSNSPSPGPSGDRNISVTFRLIGSTKSPEDVDLGAGTGSFTYQTWIPTRKASLSRGATVYDLFTRMLDEAGLRSAGAENNYVETVWAPASLGGYALSEFTNGPRSGWMYTLNGAHPGYGLREQKLSDGDAVVWHYVNDYAYEVKDWFNDSSWPAQGDASTWVDWDAVPDTLPGSGKPSGNGSSGSGSGTGAGSGTPEPPAVTLRPEAGTDRNGEASAKVSAEEMSGAVKAAAQEKADTVVIEPEVKGSASKVTAEIPASSAGELAQAGLSLSFRSPAGSVTLPAGSLKGLDGKSSESLHLSAEQRKDGSTVIQIRSRGTVLEKLASGLTAEIPAEAGSGSVLVCIGAGGKETVVRKCVQGDGTLVALLDGSCTLAVRDRAKQFADVEAGAWYEDAAAFASSRELITGVEEDRFAPEMEMSRAMTAAVLWRLESEPLSSAQALFPDTPEGTWYAEAARWAGSTGIVNGTGDGHFAPDDPVTREQLAAMVCRYAESIGVKLPAGSGLDRFTDGEAVSPWAREAMESAAAAGLFQGDGTGALRPAGRVTRAEAASILQRLTGLVVNKQN